MSVLLGKGDGTFQDAQNYAVGSFPDSVAVGDFNGDGFPDFAVANRYGGTVTVLLNAADWGGGLGRLRLADPPAARLFAANRRWSRLPTCWRRP